MEKALWVYAWLVSSAWVGLWFKCQAAIEDRDRAENAYRLVVKKINDRAHRAGQMKP